MARSADDVERIRHSTEMQGPARGSGGTVNTRWRDFADTWTLSSAHAVDGGQLHTAIAKVASHRNTQLAPLREVLEGYPVAAQAKWAAWRRKQKFDGIPADVDALLEDLFVFADPAVAGGITAMTWGPSAGAWRTQR